MESTFLTGIHIHKVRHLENIEIPLSAGERKNLLITGKNGSGKTSVLEALVGHLQYITKETYFPEDTCRRIMRSKEQDIRTAENTEAGKRRVAEARKEIKVWNEELLHWTSGAVFDCASIETLREKFFDGKFLLAYFGDKRLMKVRSYKNIEKIDLQPVYKIDAAPAQDLAKYLVNLKTTQAFALTSGKQERAQRIEAWFQRFVDILREIYDDASLQLDFDIETYQFTIRMDNREPFDFNTMSAGYAAVFDIISNLIMRMEVQHDYNMEGIVLIDEIETHLHVELQKQIVPILTGLFPNIQFIMTTHSPFILNSAPNSVVYDLEKHQLVEDGLTNLPYEGIVESYFCTDLLSQELREKFERYRALAQKEDLTSEDLVEADGLAIYLDEVPDYLAVDFATDYSRLKLELTNRRRQRWSK